ncbi:hypothetical protein VTN77DRAFT_6624 [Rasamsonia byssochlamydoides]|uniref:uncharacterized protein n=1 Tax=Rasamsonia byssochlamydoides TaxID=89139 RepID=UPI0037440C22
MPSDFQHISSQLKGVRPKEGDNSTQAQHRFPIATTIRTRRIYSTTTHHQQFEDYCQCEPLRRGSIWQRTSGR